MEPYAFSNCFQVKIPQQPSGDRAEEDWKFFNAATLSFPKIPSAPAFPQEYPALINNV